MEVNEFFEDNRSFFACNDCPHGEASMLTDYILNGTGNSYQNKVILARGRFSRFKTDRFHRSRAVKMKNIYFEPVFIVKA